MRNDALVRASIPVLILAAAAGIGLFTPGTNLLAVGVLCIAAFIVLRERISLWGLALIVLAFGVGIGRLYLVFGPNPLNSSRLQQIALFLLALLAFIAIVRQSKLKSREPIHLHKVVLAGMTIYIFLVVVAAVIDSPSIRNADYFRGALEVTLIAPLAFFIATFLFDGDRNARQFLVLCFWIGVLQAALALAQMAYPLEFDSILQRLSPAEAGLNYYAAMQRVNGIWTHAPELGGLMALMFPIGIYVMRTSNGFHRAASIFGFAAIVFIAFATASLTSIVAGFSFAFIYLALDASETGREKLLNLVLLCLIGGGLLLSLSQVLRVDVNDIPIVNRVLDPQGGDSVESSAESRMTVYQAALHLWSEDPLWGVGVGQFRNAQTTSLDLSAHRVFLQALAETGLAGLAGLFCLLASQLWMNGKLLSLLHRSERILYVPILLILPIILTVSILDFTFNKWNFQILFWFSQGILARKLALILARNRKKAIAA